jgi:arsenate reductase
MTVNTPMNTPTTPCPQCNAPMSCGVNEKSCWCQSLPSLPKAQLTASNACLCPACLKAELKKGLVMFGISNCDTVKKARAKLADDSIDYVFWDFKKHGVPADWLDEWVAALGWEVLLNQRGTTWRKLSPEVQAGVVDAASAKTLMLANPSVIKRPVVSHFGSVQIGIV